MIHSNGVENYFFFKAKNKSPLYCNAFVKIFKSINFVVKAKNTSNSCLVDTR